MYNRITNEENQIDLEKRKKELDEIEDRIKKQLNSSSNIYLIATMIIVMGLVIYLITHS